MNKDQFNLLVPNSVYGWIVADVLSGLNFGYLNGKYGNDVRNWYGVPPTEFPFGGARTTNDGFYNPWAALIYNNSNSYGFAFSDRSGPSPAMPLNTGDTLRITILPDQRLDAPRVTVTGATPNSIAISWPAVAGATGYDIEVMPPNPAHTTPIEANPGTNSYTIPGLNAGTPYTISVIATGTGANKNPVQSVAIPVQATITGSIQATTGTIPFVMGFNWADPPAGATVSINGSPLNNNNGGSMALTGQPGTNSYVLGILDANQSVIFQNNVFVTFEGSRDSYRLGTHFLLGGNQTPLAQTGPPNTPPYSAGLQVAVGIPYTPLPDKALSTVVFPGKVTSRGGR